MHGRRGKTTHVGYGLSRNLVCVSCQHADRCYYAFQMDQAARPRNRWRTLQKRVAAFLCLMPLLLGQSEVLPGLLAFAAGVEGSHTVRVGMSQSEFKLVLSHERGRPGRSDYNPRHSPTQAAHHHGVASKILCTLAGAASPGLPDHVAAFGRSSTSESSGRVTAPASKRLPNHLVGFVALDTRPLLPQSPILQRNVAGPPSNAHLLPALATVVLVI